MRGATKRTVLAGVAVLASLACTLGPEAVRPPVPVAPGDAFVGAAPHEADAEPVVAEWWAQIGDDDVSALVREALDNNLDLRVAAARVLEARAGLRAARGARLPEAGAAFDVDRAQRTFDFGGDRFSVRTTTYTVEGSVRWQLDLFGKLRRQQEAQWYRLLASEAAERAVVHSVIAEVVRTRALLASLDQRLAIASERSESFETTARLVQARVTSELADELSLRAAQDNLAESRAREPGLVEQRQAARHALDVLVGRRPGTGAAPGAGLALHPPRERPPAGLPVGLLDRRPDLQQTELVARTRQAEIGVALADLYPDLSIGGGAGFQSGSLADLLDSQSEVWSIFGGIAQKIFQGGALRAEVDASKARAEAAAAEYGAVVLAALREVEDALVRDRTLWERHDHLVAQVTAAREAERLATMRYDAGLTDLLDLLETKRRRFDAEDQLAAARQDLWDARVDLVLALGGDWNREP